MKWILIRAAREYARRHGKEHWLVFLPFIPVFLALATLGLILIVVTIAVAGQLSGGCGTTVPISAAGNVKNEAAFVQYLESQGITPNGAAGVTGNLEQESGLNATTPGGGLAQWMGGRWTAMIAWVQSHGLDPNSNAGQLTYIVYDLRTHYANVLSELNKAPDVATAVLAFESGYEQCSGTSGFMNPVPKGALCNPDARNTFAASALAAAGGGASVVPVSTGCVAVGGGNGDPIPGFTPSRDDMGVDACGRPGMPILAPAQSTLVDYQPNWYAGQPLLLFQFTPPLSGTYRGDQYWFVAEQITPATIQLGTVFGPGQPVATYAAAGTCVEIGWGSITAGGDTLAQSIGRGADRNPPAGALTPEAEAFKIYFHIPWVGQSP